MPNQPLSGVSMIAVAFVLISIIGQLSSVVASIGNRMIAKRLGLTLAGDIFDRLANKGIDWFQATLARLCVYSISSADIGATILR
ncbi:MAG: hypothetical protein HC782_02930 [Gammaproteobacteria bacterium]|nr:hypothetical protein [Gammaproteobacteria bacterium]